MIAISTAHNNARLLGTLAFLDTGDSPATVSLYAGTRPEAGASVANAPLAIITLAKPCAVLTEGQLLLSPPPAHATVTTNGTAVWARFSNGAGDWAMDCDVSDDAGNGEIKLASTTLYAGGLVPLSTANPSTIG
jgi:hypothetical protein